MAAVADARPAGSRLDPLALPADTPFRFALLVAAVLGSTLYVYDWLYLRHAAAPATADRQEACLRATDVAIARAVTGGRGVVGPDCLGIDRGPAQWMLGGAFWVVVAALVVYLVLPRWRILRGHLVPLPAADIPGLATTLDGLTREARPRSS
jgi:hypothetical protein